MPTSASTIRTCCSLPFRRPGDPGLFELHGRAARSRQSACSVLRCRYVHNISGALLGSYPRSSGTTRPSPRYRSGASLRASLAPSSQAESADGTIVGRGGCSRGGHMRMSPSPENGDYAQIRSQDDAPLCFRLFGGYYSSGRPGATLRVGSKNILEGQCASRARLRITQCKRST